MSYRIEKTICILEKEVRICCYSTECGINVMVEGGDQGHIGAVAIVAPDVPMQVVAIPSHKETVICERWAAELFEKFHVPVVVEAGVHFDDIEKSKIEIVLERLEEALLVLTEDLEREVDKDV